MRTQAGHLCAKQNVLWVVRWMGSGGTCIRGNDVGGIQHNEKLIAASYFMVLGGSGLVGISRVRVVWWGRKAFACCDEWCGVEKRVWDR